MSESLEAQLTDSDISGNSQDIEGFKISDLIRELNLALNESSFFSKSKISHQNLRGILKANAFQNYLFHKYGWRIAVLDKLIIDKLQQALSVDGVGRKDILDAISKGTMKIEAKSGLDLADRLLGNPPR